MKTAKLIKEKLDDFIGHANLYKLSHSIKYDKPWNEIDPPAKKTKYVIVSAVSAMITGPETYIFPANSKGEIIDWGELDGSFKGGLDHSKALQNAGFSII